jgi:hypothetical protein
MGMRLVDVPLAKVATTPVQFHGAPGIAKSVPVRALQRGIQNVVGCAAGHVEDWEASLVSVVGRSGAMGVRGVGEWIMRAVEPTIIRRTLCAY